MLMFLNQVSDGIVSIELARACGIVAFVSKKEPALNYLIEGCKEVWTPFVCFLPSLACYWSFSIAIFVRILITSPTNQRLDTSWCHVALHLIPFQSFPFSIPSLPTSIILLLLYCCFAQVCRFCRTAATTARAWRRSTATRSW